MTSRRWLVLLCWTLAAWGQAPPRLLALFPPGGKTGTKVEVVLRGGIAGASQLLVFGDGVTGSLKSSEVNADPAARKLFQQRCATCHELRGPDNRQLTPAQWTATVDRMIQRNNADINRADRDQIVAYLRQQSAAGLVTGTLDIASDAKPGRREVRVVNPNGVSNAFPFFVSDLPEVLDTGNTTSFETSRPLTMPVVVNGACERPQQVSYFKLDAKEGQRLLFRVSAYRLNEESQSFFSAVLHLYDADHKLVTKNLGFEDLDPQIDLTMPRTGTYYLTVRDLLYRGGPGCVWRLEAGELGYHQYIYPLGGQRGAPFEAVVGSANQPLREWKSALDRALPAGLTDLETPFGLFRFHVSDYPDVFAHGDGSVVRLRTPCVINGWLSKPGAKDRYLLPIRPEDVHLLAPWALVGPFDAANGGLDQIFEPEREVLAGRFDPAREYPAKGGLKKWEIKEPGPDGNYVYPAGTQESWYAVHTFNLTNEGQGLLSMGTDDQAKAWVNGQLVFCTRAMRPVRPADDLVPVKLKRGLNTILIKVLNVSGVGGFTASAGAWNLEVFARRLGSPLRPLLKLGFGRQWIWQSNRALTGAERPGGDVRCDWSFNVPGEYGIEIEDADGGGGDRYGYRLVVGPSQPLVTLRALPANPSVPRGGVVPLTVERGTLSGFSGDLALRVDGLPAGVQAEPVVMPADVTQATILLTGHPTAAAASAPVRVLAEVPSIGGLLTFTAEPLDFFRIQNEPIPIRRAGMAVAMVPQEAPYTLRAAPDSLEVEPGKRFPITVSLTRRPGFAEDVTLLFRGLPPALTGNAAVLRGGKTQATIELNCGPQLRNESWGASLQADAYRCVVVGLAGGDGLSGGTMYASNPVVLRPFDPAKLPRPTAPSPTTTPSTPAATMSADAAAGRGVLEKKCTRCHALIDPTETRKSLPEWTTTVDRMIGRGAQVSPQEKAQLLAYIRTVTARQAR